MTDSSIKTYNRDKFEAFLGSYMTFGSYLSSYENAFNALIDKVDTSGSHVDTLAYPILFTARHAIELGLKSNIRYFSKYSEKPDFVNKNTHILLDLFDAFKLHIRETIKNLKEKHEIEVSEDAVADLEFYYDYMDSLIDKFETLDKRSFSFRYPFDPAGKKVFQPSDKINILDIKELFDNSMLLLKYTSDVFSKYTDDYPDEIEKFYADEMKQEYGY